MFSLLMASTYAALFQWSFGVHSIITHKYNLAFPPQWKYITWLHMASVADDVNVPLVTPAPALGTVPLIGYGFLMMFSSCKNFPSPHTEQEESIGVLKPSE